MNNWNVMCRWPNEPHFHPLWSVGVSETEAREYYHYRIRDIYYNQAEHQLVTDFAAHRVTVPDPGLGEPNRTTTQNIIDSWTAVPVNG